MELGSYTLFTANRIRSSSVMYYTSQSVITLTVIIDIYASYHFMFLNVVLLKFCRVFPHYDFSCFFYIVNPKVK